MNDILGKSSYGIKGKIVRGQPNVFETEVILLPKNIYEHYSIVIICVDVMFVNRVVLLIIVFRNIHNGTTVYEFASMKIPVLETAIKNIIVKLYLAREFMVKFILIYL